MCKFEQIKQVASQRTARRGFCQQTAFVGTLLRLLAFAVRFLFEVLRGAPLKFLSKALKHRLFYVDELPLDFQLIRLCSLVACIGPAGSSAAIRQAITR